MHILRTDAGVNTLIALKVEGAGDMRVLVKEYQLHPVTRKLLHADFFRIAMDKVLRVTVQVRADRRGQGRQGAGRHCRIRAPRAGHRVSAGGYSGSTSRST